MMMKSNRNIHAYLRAVSAHMICSLSAKAVFLKKLKEEILNHPDIDADTTAEQLYALLGTPEEVADSFSEREDYRELYAKARRQMFVLSIVGSVLLVFAAVCIGYLLYINSIEVIISDVY